MDKSWMNLSRADPRYLQGLIDFMAFACKDIYDGKQKFRVHVRIVRICAERRYK